MDVFEGEVPGPCYVGTCGVCSRQIEGDSLSATETELLRHIEAEHPDEAVSRPDLLIREKGT